MARVLLYVHQTVKLVRVTQFVQHAIQDTTYHQEAALFALQNAQHVLQQQLVQHAKLAIA